MAAISPGIRSQTQLDELLTFDGSITSGGTAQLVLNQQPGRTSLFIQNTSDTNMTLGLGPATATATLSTGTVTSVAVNNAGVGYAVAPQVLFLGGLVSGDFQNAPSHPAAAHCVMTGSGVNQSVSSIAIDDPGAGYVVAPYVFLRNPLPQLGGGAFVPSATAGILLTPGWTFSASEMLIVPSSACALFCASSAKTFVVKVGGLAIH